MTPASVIPVFGSRRPYADLNFAAGSFGLNGTSVSSLALLAGFTFTRASLAMGYDATGKLTYGPNNLLLQSQTFDNASWTKTSTTVSANTVTAPDGTLTADTLVEDVALASHQVLQSVTGNGSGAIFSCYAKPAGRDWIALSSVNAAGTLRLTYFNISTGVVGTVGTGVTATITDAGNGWYRCAVYMPSAFAGAYNSRIYLCQVDNSTSYTGDGVSGVYLWGAQLEAVTYQTTPSTYYPTTTAAYYGPRLVYDPVTLASQGILVEEARTNSAVQSQDFSTTWTLSRASVSVNATTSPDGTSNADRLVEDLAAANTHRIFGAATTTAAAWTWSVYAKANTRSWIYLRIDRNGGTTPNAWFDLANGVVGTAETGLTSSIQNVGNGWYRCVVTVDTATAAANSPLIGLSTGNGVLNYNGDGTSGAFIWQAQLEAGTGASSPIPTTTASVTRAADDAVVTGLSLPGASSLVTEGLVPAFVSTDARSGLSDGATANRLWLTYNGSVLNLAATIANSSVSPVATATLAGGVAFKAGAVSSNGTYLTAVNGGTVQSASGGVMPTLNRLDIGKNAGTSLRYWNNTISRIRIYNRALSNAELQAITT